jgi:D-alanyl-D-alanine carboxypeptidase
MKKKLRTMLGATATFAMVGAAAAAWAVPAGAATARPAASQAARLAALAEQDVKAGAPGVIVQIREHGRPVVTITRQAAFTRADGTLSADDQFRMGSNTKTMVSVLILQLVAEHRIALSDPVGKYLPGLIPNGQAITIRMLLNHTSGLFNDINDPGVLAAFTGQDPRHWTPRQLIQAAVSHPPLFAPGTRYSYSNTNYIALGLIAEKITGNSLGELIQQRIAGPLGLRHTFLAGFRAPGDLADGYEPDAARLATVLPPGTPKGTHFVGPARGDWVDTTWVNESTEWAAGGIVSTAADWATFQAALMSGRLLPPAQLAQMRDTVSEGSSTPNRYGLGIERVVTPAGVVWGHDGQVPGYSSWDYTTSDGSATVAVYVTTVFGLAGPAAATATENLLGGAIDAMLGKPIPAS